MAKIRVETFGDHGEERGCYFGNVQHGYRIASDEEQTRFWYEICYRGASIYDHKNSYTNRKAAQKAAVARLHRLEKVGVIKRL
jgi:hypothetical protein